MPTVRLTNFDGMLNTGASDFLMQDSELTACKNVWVYKIGRLEKVPGYEKCNANVVVSGENVNYLHHYYDTANSVNYLLATSDSGTSDFTLRYRTDGAWATIGSIGTTWNTYVGSSPCMANYLGKAFIVGHKSGSTFLPNATIKATVFSATDSDITDMPQGKFIVRFRDLLYVLYVKEAGGTIYPSRAYFCNEPTANAISWSPLTEFVDFGYDDGDVITAAAESLDRLIVFKNFSMWSYDESNKLKIAEIGCSSYKSLAKIDNIIYWFNSDGFFRWRGGVPELISEKAKEFINAINSANITNVVATVYHGFEYRAFIGTVTVHDRTYENAWFCWDTRRERCYIRCTSHVAKSACIHVEDNKKRAYFGGESYVYKFANKIDNIYADDDAEIDSFFITKPLDHGMPEAIKFSNHMTVFTKYGAGMKIAVGVDGDNNHREDNKPINTNIEHIDFGASGNNFQYKFYQKGSGKSWEFDGFTLQTELKEEET